ncbi:hypothetical protein [Nocardia salmonicida]|uniref:hypothetical protein n=1 Tax=Nocardia salmonicida TaxID=53431 RepID=UPI0033D745A6
MITAISGTRTRRSGLSIVGATAVMVLAAPTAYAEPAPLVVSSDNGRHYLGHTYTLSVAAADPPRAGTVTFCAAAGGIMTCYPPIVTADGSATREWTPTKLAIYKIDYKFKHSTGTTGNQVTIYVKS